MTPTRRAGSFSPRRSAARRGPRRDAAFLHAFRSSFASGRPAGGGFRVTEELLGWNSWKNGLNGPSPKRGPKKLSNSANPRNHLLGEQPMCSPGFNKRARYGHVLSTCQSNMRNRINRDQPHNSTEWPPPSSLRGSARGPRSSSGCRSACPPRSSYVAQGARAPQALPRSRRGPESDSDQVVTGIRSTTVGVRLRVGEANMFFHLVYVLDSTPHARTI